MRYLLSFLFLISVAYGQKVIYVSPSGSDNGNGSKTSPYFNITKAWQSVAAGDTIYARGGTYKYTKSQYLSGKNGSSGKMIHVFAYPGEVPVFTNGSNYSGNDLFEWTGNWIHWKGLEIANFTGNLYFSAFRSESCNNNIFEQIYYHHNPMGFTIRNCNNNLILNCDFAFNQDQAGDNADGLNITYVSNGNYSNTVRGCRAWNNSDDGFDFWYNKGYVLIENSWAWKNGYNRNGGAAGDGSGFKMGEYGGSTSSLKRTVRNCISANNKLWGFNENNCLTRINISRTTAYGNGNKGYWFGDWGNHPMTVDSNINFGGSVTFNGSQIVQKDNSWQGGRTVTNADFASVDASQLTRPRKADGSLPDITFLQVVPGSDLAGIGANFASGNTPPPPPSPNQAPTVSIGPDITISLPNASITLTGTGNDPDGEIVKWEWRDGNGGLVGLDASISLSFTAPGTYPYTLKVTDNVGGSAEATINVTVLAAPQPTQLFTIWIYTDRTIGKTKNPNKNKTVWFSIKVFSDGTYQ